MAEDKEQTIFGMKVQVRDDIPAGEVWLVGPPRLIAGVEVRDHVRVTDILVSSKDTDAQGVSVVRSDMREKD